MSVVKKIKKNFLRRQERTRIKLREKAKGKARLSIFFSNTHIYAQLIDDTKSTTVAFSSTKNLKLKGVNIELAKKVGKDIAEKIKKLKIKEIVFDRGGYLYHGKVKALANSARESGIKF